MKWIKCCEQMPKEDEEVLAWGGAVRPMFFEDDMWFHAVMADEGVSKEVITHWMPLPETPDIQYKRLKEMEDEKAEGHTIKCEWCNRPACNYCN